MSRYIEKIYEYIPLILQNFVISLYGLYWRNRRYGKFFHENILEFKKRELFSKEEWIDYQTLQLRKILIHSFNNVPFYKKKYSELGFTESDFYKFSLEDLKKLPVLEKEDLRKHGDNTLLSTIRKKGKFISSSGSTGTPVKIYYSKQFHQIWQAAYETRVRNWAGVNYKMSRGMIGGRRILPKSDAKPPYYRYNYFEKQTYFSAYHLSQNTVRNYVEGLILNNVDYLVGYAMSIYIWSDLINKLNINTPKLVAVLTSSEKLTNNMRMSIEKAFNCKVFDAYSGVEACGLISENDLGELLFSPDTGVMEIVESEGNIKSLEGELLLTGFLNYDQPLIRYSIGDTVKRAENQMTKSEINFEIIEEISGRIEDVIQGIDGRKMVRFHSVFINIQGLKYSQIIQHKINFIEVKLVTDNTYNIISERTIRHRIVSQLGEIEIEFSYPDDLPRTKNGKIKAVISKIND